MEERKKKNWTVKYNDVPIEPTVFKHSTDSTHESVKPQVIRHGGDKHNRSQAVEVIDHSNHRPNAHQANNPRVVDVIARGVDSAVTNINNNAKPDFAPVVGYAKEPILSLFQTCAPLADTIHNLKFYVQMALNETPEQPPDGLTIDESAAIRLYTIEWEKPHRSLYSLLNYILMKNDRELLRPYFKYLKLFITALVKLPCTPQLTIWRGVTKNLSEQFLTETPVTWWAFSSCTTTLPVLKNNTYLGNTGDRTLFSVEAINGRRISAHSHFVTEDEILLLPGTHMIVQSQFSPGDNLHIIHMKQVIPEEMLLEPPFEGNFNASNHLSPITIFLCLGACLYPKMK